MERHDAMEAGQWVEARLAQLGGDGLDGGWSPDAVRGLARLRQRRPSASHRRAWAAAAGLALAGGCLLLTVTVMRAFASRCVEACGQFVWRASSTATPDRTGRKQAPDFTLNDAGGNPVRLSDFRGKVVLLNFWATWCKPCAVEIPWFMEFERSYRDRGLVVLGVSLDEDGWKAVKTFIDGHGVNYRVVVGGDAVARMLGGVESLPATLIVDRQGRVAATHVGLVGKPVYETGIRAVLGE